LATKLVPLSIRQNKLGSLLLSKKISGKIIPVPAKVAGMLEGFLADCEIVVVESIPTKALA